MFAKIQSIKNNSMTFYTLLAGVVFFAFIYIYSVNAAVRNVVVREAAESELGELRNRVSELEYKYMNTENRLTIEQANHLGLREPEQKNFIARDGKSAGKQLTINKP